MGSALFLWSMLGGVELGAVCLVIVALAFTVRPLLLSPLRRFPGPFWAKISPLWLTTQSRHLHRSLKVSEQHSKHGKFVRIAPNHISINDTTAVQQIYGHKTGFTKAPFYDAFFQVRPVIFTARDTAVHHERRRLINPAFSARALSRFEKHMDEEIIAFQSRMRTFCEARTLADLTVETNYLAFDIIGSFAFGEPFGFVVMGEDPYGLIDTIDRRGEVINALATLPAWTRVLMKYNYLDSFWLSGLRAKSSLEKFGRDAYQRRRLGGAAGRNDLLSLLLDAKVGETGQPLSEADIVAESISFIVGGSDTTSSTMSSFFDIVSRNIPVQQKLQAELDEAFPAAPSLAWVAPESIAGRLPYLNAVLREVMRIRPTSSTGLERLTPSGGKVVAGEFFPEGTILSVPTFDVMRQSHVFSQPSKFLPERWLQSDTQSLLDNFLPFSTGPRSCIGRNFAWMEMVKTIGTLFRSFTLERVATGPTEVREGFFNKIGECKVRLHYRHPSSVLTDNVL